MGMLRKFALGCGGLAAIAVAGTGATVAYAYATADARLSAPATPLPAIVAATDPASIERGRYLVYGPAHCSQCHGAYTRDNPAGNVPGVPLTGGFEFAMGPMGTTYSANLTPDPATGIGSRTDAELARTIRTGVLSDGRISLLMRFSAANLADDPAAARLPQQRSLTELLMQPSPMANLTSRVGNHAAP